MSRLSTAHKCAHCSAELDSARRECPSCHKDVGFPNVRECDCELETSTVRQNYENAKRAATSKGSGKEFKYVEKKLNKHACVVVCMSPLMAINLFEDPRGQYLNYEKLVGSGARTTAPPDNDKQRREISGRLFGTYAEKIVYGALAVRTIGVHSYGLVSCRLKNENIEHRTSFLKTNSFKFHSTIKRQPQGIPPGYRATWQNKHELALAKIEKKLSHVHNLESLQSILVQVDSADRNHDEYIEAHIYEGFDSNAIEELAISAPANRDKLHEIKTELLRMHCKNRGVRIQ